MKKYLAIFSVIFIFGSAHAKEWQQVPDKDLAGIRGGFSTELAGIGVDLNWLVQVDVNDQRVFSHDITNDFTGKLVSISNTGDISIGDFQALALVLQNSSDNIKIQTQQILDMQLTNIAAYQAMVFSSQLNQALTQALPN